MKKRHITRGNRDRFPQERVREERFHGRQIRVEQSRKPRNSRPTRLPEVKARWSE